MDVGEWACVCVPVKLRQLCLCCVGSAVLRFHRHERGAHTTAYTAIRFAPSIAFVLGRASTRLDVPLVCYVDTVAFTVCIASILCGFSRGIPFGIFSIGQGQGKAATGFPYPFRCR